MLSGSTPFQIDDDAALLWAHIASAPPPLSDRVDGLPIEVDRILQRAMAKDPSERPASCRKLVAELRDAMRGAASAPRRGQAAPDGPAAPPTKVITRTGPDRDGGRPPHTPPTEPPPARPVPAPGAEPGGARRPKSPVPLVGAALVALLLLALGAWLLIARPWAAWVTYDGGQAAAPFTLEHPPEWLEHPDRQGVMFAEQHLVGIFTTGDPRKWDQATQTADAPEMIEGLLLRRTAEQVSLASPAVARDTVVAIPAFQPAVLSEPARATVHGAQAWRIDGKLTDPRSPSGLTIAFEYYLVPIPGGTAHAIFFGLPDRMDSRQATFERVRDSIELPAE